jgi:hypothetical protein
MKIPALRVEVNDEVVAIAGAENLDLLTGLVSFGASPSGGIDISRVISSIMGISVRGPEPQQLTWANAIKLKLGDRITFEIVEVDQPSPPDQVLRTPSSPELANVTAAGRKQKRRCS